MENKDLVSIVIPAYNAENIISNCLHAATHQTYKNIEIIIIDDGSQDSTKKTCDEYAEDDARIKVFSIKHSGASCARNCGMDKATGKYVVFFDADDRPEGNLIECYISALNEWSGKDVALAICGMFFDNLLYRNVEDKIVLLEPNYGYKENENYLLNRNYVSTLAWLKIFNFVTNKIYDLDIIRKYRIRFNVDYSVGEDLAFNLEYLDNCSGNIGMINKPLYHYIKRSNESLSLTYHENDLENIKAIYCRFLDWESKQDGITNDNILVLKSLFINSWLSRLTKISDAMEKDKSIHISRRDLNKEIGSDLFQEMLKQVYRGKKIGTIRYMCLRTRNFAIFCLLRKLYQITKG